MSQTAQSTQLLLSRTGAQNNPIAILDEQEEKSFYDNLLQISRNQEIIKKALLCKTSLDIVFALVKTKFPGEFTYKEECLKKQLIQYFYDKLKINILYESFTSRLQPDYSNVDTTPLGTSIIVYGVDFLDTRQIGKMFSWSIEGTKGIIKKITWINDSNVQIVFFNPQITQTVIERLTSNVNNHVVKIEEEASGQLSRGWFELNSYNIFGIERKIFARYATTLELDLKKTNEVSRHTIFENAQKGLQLYLLTKFQAIEDFQNIMKQIEYDSYRKSVFNQNRYFNGFKNSFGNQRKFDEYRTKGKDYVNFKLNFQQHSSQKQSQSILGPKAEESVQVQEKNNKQMIVERNDINMKQRQSNSTENNVNLVENKENTMVNEADEDLSQNRQKILNCSKELEGEYFQKPENKLDTKQMNKPLQKPSNGDSKAKPSGNNYQKSKLSLAEDDFDEPSSY